MRDADGSLRFHHAAHAEITTLHHPTEFSQSLQTTFLGLTGEFAPFSVTNLAKKLKQLQLVQCRSPWHWLHWLSEAQLVMGKFGSEPRSKPELDRTGPHFKFRVRVFDPNRTAGSVRSSGSLAFLLNAFEQHSNRTLGTWGNENYFESLVYPKKSTKICCSRLY